MHVSCVMVHKCQEPISHETEWNAWPSLHLGDAHRGEPLRLPKRSPIPVVLNPKGGLYVLKQNLHMNFD